MKINECVENYSKLQSNAAKKAFIEKIVDNKYAPILTKRLVLESMLKKSIVTDNNGVRYIDMFVSQINFTCAVLALYTKLELPNTDEEETNIYEQYDLLVASDMLPQIMSAINQEELNRLISVNKQVMDNFYNKEKTTEAYISRTITQFTTVLGTMCNSGLEQISQIVDDEKKMKRLAKQFEAMIEKAKK